MTTNYRRDWHNMSNVYNKQPVRDTPHGRSPNSAIHAIDHFSKPHIVRRYSNPDGYFDDGFAKRGQYERLTLWCFIRNKWAGRKEEAVDSYENGIVITEGQLALYYNPFYYKHPPEGIHLHLTNPVNDFTTDSSGFADIIEYRGLLWKVVEHNSHDVAYGEGEEYMGEALIERYKPNVVNESNYVTDNFTQNTQIKNNNYKIK